ncbi:MAG: cell envelope integrity protein TolA [Thiotrichales bacterium]|jgi:colicin import membrane protein|nr:cell envelope integrity protein TolA [Thiotrichales bacterium]
MKPVTQLWNSLNQKLPPVGISILLHTFILLIVIGAGVSSIPDKPKPPKKIVIKAHAVDGRVLDAIAAKKVAVAAAKVKARQEKIANKKRKIEQDKKREAAAKKKAADKKKAANKKKAAAKKKAADKKRAADKKKKQKREVDAKKRQLLLDAELDAELYAEEKMRSAQVVASQEMAQELIKLQATIRGQIEKVWIKPRGKKVGQSCKVKVALSPSGEVLSVDVIKNSGSEAFKTSVERAVHKAAPFNMPADVTLRREMQELVITFEHK